MSMTSAKDIVLENMRSGKIDSTCWVGVLQGVTLATENVDDALGVLSEVEDFLPTNTAYCIEKMKEKGTLKDTIDMIAEISGTGPLYSN